MAEKKKIKDFYFKKIAKTLIEKENFLSSIITLKLMAKLKTFYQGKLNIT